MKLTNIVLFTVASIVSGFSAITVQPSTLGNLFLTTELVSIPVTASGQITWTITDYWGKVMDSGNINPIKPRLRLKPGYYDVTIQDSTSALKTSFGVVQAAIVSEGSPFGVHTHFAQSHDQSVIPLLAKVGLRHIRDEQYWGTVEKTKGVYVYPTQFTNYMASATANGIRPFVPLTFGNPFYDYEAGKYTAPHTDAGRAGYANYALSVLSKYPQIAEVEVWNEYNAGTFALGPVTTNKPLYYKLMLQTLYGQVKPLYPAVRLVAGATVPVAHGFFRDLFAQGAMPFIDAISVHYPRFIAVELDGLRDLIKSANGGFDKPIWVTEFSAGPANEAEQYPAASTLAQDAVLMLSQGVERMYYYLVMDDGNFPLRGLVRGPTDKRGKFAPHPVLIAYATAIRQLHNAVYQERYPTHPSIFAFKFLQGSKLMTVLWSDRPAVVALTATSNIRVTNMMGGSSDFSPGRVLINTSRDVQYVLGSVAALEVVENDCLADSISGYSKTAGVNGWSYGYAQLSYNAVYSVSKFLPMEWRIWGGDNYRWIRPGANTPFATGAQVHPADNLWAIRRWVSDYAGPAILEGQIVRGANGDGVGVRMFVDGAEVFNQRVMPSQTLNYRVPVTLQVGSRVDVTVNRWGDSNYDATRINTRIIKGTP